MGVFLLSVVNGWLAACVIDLIILSEKMTEYQFLLLVLVLANLFYQAIDEQFYKNYYIRRTHRVTEKQSNILDENNWKKGTECGK